jgi:hypothetical protein
VSDKTAVLTPLRLAAAAVFLPFIAIALQAQEPSAAPSVGYRLVKVDGVATVRALQKTYGRDGFRVILHLNRIDLPHLRDGTSLVVPETPRAMMEVSPFPASLGGDVDQPPRLLVVSRRIQALAAYESGRLVRWAGVSTGRRETQTPAGLFATNWRAKLRRSSDNASWLLPWYVNFVNATGVSFHQFDLPGEPASHACVRLLQADAQWIYDWAELWVLADGGRRIVVHGTPVLIFGDYDFDRPGPWTRLAENPRATTITPDELRVALAPHRATIAERTATRVAWLAQKKP